MSITPRGMSIQEAYRNFRDGSFVVNRRYQRKLVWTTPEKERLIDSIFHQYPIPLILLANAGGGKLEIIDGMQRLNAIFGFIENQYSYSGQWFDILEFTRAKKAADDGAFKPIPREVPFVTANDCADFLDYQLAVTTFEAEEESHTVSVFGRINSGGRQLSDQERRQAGVTSQFADLVRKLSSELRGDASRQTLLLSEMPEISIESNRATQGYSLVAEEIFWCRQGIINALGLVESHDEEIVADIAASILLKAPLARNRELLDSLYDTGNSLAKQLNDALAAYTSTKLSMEIVSTFSVLKELIAEHDDSPGFLRKLVREYNDGNPIKVAFYSIFMAFFDLVVQKEMSPADTKGLFSALEDVNQKLKQTTRFNKSEDRQKNIDIVTGLIAKFFVKKEPSALKHGPGLALDFENSIRRSKIETPRYELKQGLLRLDASRKIDSGVVDNIVATACAIANSCHDAPGYISIGVADKKADADRITQLDGVKPIEILGRYVVGIEREASILKKKVDDYPAIILDAIRQAGLSEPLKTQLLSSFDVVTYNGLTVLRLAIPIQKQVSLLNGKCFIREGSSTVEITTDIKKVLAIHESFKK